MTFTTQQIHGGVRDTYNHVNETVYGGRLPAWGSFEFRITDSARQMGCVMSRRSGGYYMGSEVRHHIVRLDISRRSPTLADLANTVRHEIAHIACLVLDGQGGHGYHWMQHARKCGAEPVRCYSGDVARRPGDFVLYCPKECGKEFVFTKRTKNVQRALAGSLQVRCPNGCGITNYLVRRV